LELKKKPGQQLSHPDFVDGCCVGIRGVDKYTQSKSITGDRQ